MKKRGALRPDGKKVDRPGETVLTAPPITSDDKIVSKNELLIAVNEVETVAVPTLSWTAALENKAGDQRWASDPERAEREVISEPFELRSTAGIDPGDGDLWLLDP